LRRDPDKRITLPKEIRDRLGLDVGSVLDFQVLH
jgi:AbrB family looped-hinge helix DNA binding protein